eukprot:1120977-Pelagomonas_calceolata.AAC.3
MARPAPGLSLGGREGDLCEGRVVDSGGWLVCRKVYTKTLVANAKMVVTQRMVTQNSTAHEQYLLQKAKGSAQVLRSQSQSHNMNLGCLPKSSSPLAMPSPHLSNEDFGGACAP